MPWKASSSMDERVRFIARYNEEDTSLAELCRQFGISRKTAYKWLERYAQEGPEGLRARRSIAHVFPHATPAELVEMLVELRKNYPTWGPKKLRAKLINQGVERVPAVSTIGELLKKHGLIRPRRRRVYPPRMPTNLVEAKAPNDTWCVDFKGHFALGDKTRCHPLTLSDCATRYLLKCEGLTRTAVEFVKPHFELAFREFGLPDRIRSDNGPPFATPSVGGLSALSVWWIQLGITPERIEPGAPQQNGRHERMHKTLGAETANPSEANLQDQQRAFDRFRHIYNDERPHEALGQKPPGSHYTPSRRHMPDTPKSPEYPDHMKVRKLDSQGRCCFPKQQAKTTFSKLLANEPIGLDPIDEDSWNVYYGPVLLAQLTLKNKDLRLEKVK